MKAPIFDAVIFDIDNVLIDTRRSYLEAIRHTVEIYLTHGGVPLFKPPLKSRQPQLLSLEDVNEFKLLGGFNDDWDCCYGMLIYLLSLPVKKRTLEDLRAAMNFRTFAGTVKERPLRVSGIVRMLGRNPAVKIEKISRIFQEVYLGKQLFYLTEKRNCVYWKKRGLIHKEKFAFRKSFLEKLKKMGVKLGIATGRPRYEAIYALRHFGVFNLFDAITTMDDVKKSEAEQKQSLRKPHPFSLLETAKKIGAEKRFLYLGDLPDDIAAAKKAAETLQFKAAACFFLSDGKTARRELKASLPDFTLERPSDLVRIVLG